MTNQDIDYDYFLKNHDHILASYPESFVIISNCSVKGSAKTFEDALSQALNSGYQPGEFIIQECTQGQNGYTQKFHSGKTMMSFRMPSMESLDFTVNKENHTT